MKVKHIRRGCHPHLKARRIHTYSLPSQHHFIISPTSSKHKSSIIIHQPRTQKITCLNFSEKKSVQQASASWVSSVVCLHLTYTKHNQSPSIINLTNHPSPSKKASPGAPTPSPKNKPSPLSTPLSTLTESTSGTAANSTVTPPTTLPSCSSATSPNTPKTPTKSSCPSRDAPAQMGTTRTAPRPKSDALWMPSSSS